MMMVKDIHTMRNTNNYERLMLGESITVAPAINISLVEQSDLDDLIEMLSDERVTEYLFFAPAPEEVYRQYFQPIIDKSLEARASGQWPNDLLLVARDDQQRFIGMSGLTQVMFLEGNFEVGFQLPFTSWGKGLASRLAKILVEIAFSHLGAHKITADCYAQNIGSFKALQKSGLSEEGRQTDYYKLDHGFDDKLHMGLSKSDWQKREI